MNPATDRALILGPFQPVLETALADRIRAVQADDPGAPVVVLVGSYALTRYLPRRLAETMPLWNVRFMDFRGLVAALRAERPGAFRRTRLPDAAFPFLVRDVMKNRPADYFEPVADRPGFVGRVLESIRDLKDAGIGPDVLDRRLGDKITAFRDLFAAYEERLSALGLGDAADELADAAEAAAASDRLAGAHFIAYGFYDLTGLQRRLVAAAAERALSAAALVPFAEAPAYAFARPLVRWYAEHGFERGTSTAGGDPLTARLFRPPTGEPPADRRVEILSAPGEPREVREVVRQVLALAERGVPFHEIGILLRNRTTYARLLCDTLDRCGVPYFLSGGRPLRETREARSFEMLADLLGGDLRRTDVMQFVHFAPLAFDRLLGHTPNTSHWDLLSIEAGVVSGPDDWLPRLDRLAATPPAPDDEAPAPRHRDELPHLRAFLAALIQERRILGGRTGWRGITGALLDAYRRFVARPENGAGAEAFDRVCRAVESLADLEDLGAAATLGDVREAVRESLDREVIPSTGFQRGTVYVGDLLQARGLGFRAVVVPGLVEKGFPAPTRQDPILLDGERKAIGSRAGPGAYLARKAARADEEKMLFALALGAAAEHVTLTFSRLDVTTGRERIPSHFLVRLADALTGRRHDYASLERAPGFLRVSTFPRAASDHPPLDPDDFDLQQVAELVEKRHGARALYLAAVSSPFARGIEVERSRWQESRFTRFDGLAPTAGARVADEPISPTRIEEYATCPFAYFVRRVLGAEPLDEPEQLLRLPALDRGSLIHHVLFQAYGECFGGGRTALEEELTQAVRRAADRAFRDGPIELPPLTRALERAEILADLVRFVRIDSTDRAAGDARPAMFEARFGMPRRGDAHDGSEAAPPVALDAAGRTFRFRGRIDRIDEMGADAACVIDYKTGSKTARPDAFGGGRFVQLPVYLLAAQELLPNRRVSEARYVHVTARGRFATVPFTREALDERMDELREIVATVAEGIESGLFVAWPRDKGRHCCSCPFRDVCGPNRELLFERKEEDPAVAGLLRLAEIE